MMESDLIDLVAQRLHDSWVTQMHLRGYVHGAVRGGRSGDVVAQKTHPHMVGWLELTEEDRNQDRFQARSLLQLLADRHLLCMAGPHCSPYAARGGY